MTAAVPSRSNVDRRFPALGVAAVAALAYVLCDVLHELGHFAAAALPLGVTAVSISTIGLSTIGSSVAVAAAGPAVNLVLGASLALAFVRGSSPTWRYFCWLFGSINLFDFSAYPLYSAVLGSGDWAVVCSAFLDGGVWRPLAAVTGLAAYGGSVYVASRVMRHLVASRVVAPADVAGRCTISYWTGGAVVTLGSVFNPVGWVLVLSSGVATGFGAMVGLLMLPGIVRTRESGPRPKDGSMPIAKPWFAAGLVATVLFVGVLGPGIRLVPTS